MKKIFNNNIAKFFTYKKEYIRPAKIRPVDISLIIKEGAINTKSVKNDCCSLALNSYGVVKAVKKI